jgi:hypothetical protein
LFIFTAKYYGFFPDTMDHLNYSQSDPHDNADSSSKQPVTDSSLKHFNTIDEFLNADDDISSFMLHDPNFKPYPTNTRLDESPFAPSASSDTSSSFLSPQYMGPAETPLISLSPPDSAQPSFNMDASLDLTEAGQSFLNPSAQYRERRGSIHSDVSSVVGSSAPSPYLSEAPSPFVHPVAGGELANLEELTSDFNLATPNTSSYPVNHPAMTLAGGSFFGDVTNGDHQYNGPSYDEGHDGELFVNYDNPEEDHRTYEFSSQSAASSVESSEPRLIGAPVITRHRSLSDPDVRTDTLAPPAQTLHPSHHSPAHSPSSRPGSPYLSPDVDVPRRARSISSHPAHARSRSRSSSSRDYILELAAQPQSNKRVQKHPSAYGCHLCDKRFTRAYNLRSHLRTHTDERPFVCTICSKAFARQHDRKRHEALHSGEKKFECKGFLSDGVTPWGCGRKFARADALGRHFRTEGGRECINPLLEEEAREKGLLGSGNGQPLYVGGQGYQSTPSLMLIPPDGQQMSHMLPAALLMQYPGLMNMDGDDLDRSS